jgi:hypothetical protein
MSSTSISIQVNAGSSRKTNVNALIAHCEPNATIETRDDTEVKAAAENVLTDATPIDAEVSPDHIVII